MVKIIINGIYLHSHLFFNQHHRQIIIFRWSDHPSLDWTVDLWFRYALAVQFFDYLGLFSRVFVIIVQALLFLRNINYRRIHISLDKNIHLISCSVAVRFCLKKWTEISIFIRVWNIPAVFLWHQSGSKRFCLIYSRVDMIFVIFHNQFYREIGHKMMLKMKMSN